MNSKTRLNARQDRALLRSTLLRLTAMQKILCTVGVLAVTLLWYIFAGRLLAFGLALDYAGLQAFGPQAIALLQQYSPFFWWALVIALTLIIAYFLYGIVQNSQRAVKLRIVATDAVQTLAQNLSSQGRQVLQWAWFERREPLRIGDLQRAYTELGAGRYSKIVQAREHAALLGAKLAVEIAEASEPENNIALPVRQEPDLRT